MSGTLRAAVLLTGSEIVRGAIEAGPPAERAVFFGGAAEAAEFLDGLVRSGDMVVLKGSRGVRMEQILDRLAQHYEQAQAQAAGKRERR